MHHFNPPLINKSATAMEFHVPYINGILDLGICIKQVQRFTKYVQ